MNSENKILYGVIKHIVITNKEQSHITCFDPRPYSHIVDFVSTVMRQDK